MSKIQFVAAANAEEYRAKFEKTASMAIVDSPPFCTYDSDEAMAKGECSQAYPCIDTNHNKDCDVNEIDFQLRSAFKNYLFMMTPFKPYQKFEHDVNRYKMTGELAFIPATDGSKAAMEELDVVVVWKDREATFLIIKDPEVRPGLPATHISNFKIMDLNGDGLFDIAFEFVNADANISSLQVFLQTK